MEDNTQEPEESQKEEIVQEEPQGDTAVEPTIEEPMTEEAMAAAMAEAMAEDEQQHVIQEHEHNVLSSTVSDAVFQDLSREERLSEEHFKRELDFILDIPLDISVELGRTKLIINELLQLGQGSVIELNKLAGELLEIYVNGKLLARGEAVVVNEKFGVRLTDIISPLERVKQLA